MLPFYDLNAKLRYIKYCLILFTCLLVLTGIGLIAIGSTTNAIYYDLMYFLQIDYVTPPASLVAIGFLIFAVACIGFYGTFKESPVFIIVYGLWLGIICLLLLITRTSSLRMSTALLNKLSFTMNETMYNYQYDEFARQEMDGLQQHFTCCGKKNADDWIQVFTDRMIPWSCCYKTEMGKDECSYRGCYDTLAIILQDTSQIVSSCSSILAFMQFVGMVFAFYKAYCLRQKTRARRMRQLLAERLLHSDVEGIGKKLIK